MNVTSKSDSDLPFCLNKMNGAHRVVLTSSENVSTKLTKSDGINYLISNRKSVGWTNRKCKLFIALCHHEVDLDLGFFEDSDKLWYKEKIEDAYVIRNKSTTQSMSLIDLNSSDDNRSQTYEIVASERSVKVNYANKKRKKFGTSEHSDIIIPKDTSKEKNNNKVHPIEEDNILMTLPNDDENNTSNNATIIDTSKKELTHNAGSFKSKFSAKTSETYEIVASKSSVKVNYANKKRKKFGASKHSDIIIPKDTSKKKNNNKVHPIEEDNIDVRLAGNSNIDAEELVDAIKKAQKDALNKSVDDKEKELKRRDG